MEPFLDVTTIYHHLNSQNMGKKLPKETKSLASVCAELLGISLSKVLVLIPLLFLSLLYQDLICSKKINLMLFIPALSFIYLCIVCLFGMYSDRPLYVEIVFPYSYIFISL